jgi:hypothetical protein
MSIRKSSKTPVDLQRSYFVVYVTTNQRLAQI